MTNAKTIDAAEILKRAEELATQIECKSWFVASILEFMAEALPDDPAGALPTKCVLMRLQEEAAKVAEDLGNLFFDARHE